MKREREDNELYEGDPVFDIQSGETPIPMAQRGHSAESIRYRKVTDREKDAIMQAYRASTIRRLELMRNCGASAQEIAEEEMILRDQFMAQSASSGAGIREVPMLDAMGRPILLSSSRGSERNIYWQYPGVMHRGVIEVHPFDDVGVPTQAGFPPVGELATEDLGRVVAPNTLPEIKVLRRALKEDREENNKRWLDKYRPLVGVPCTYEWVSCTGIVNKVRVRITRFSLFKPKGGLLPSVTYQFKSTIIVESVTMGREGDNVRNVMREFMEKSVHFQGWNKVIIPPTFKMLLQDGQPSGVTQRELREDKATWLDIMRSFEPGISPAELAAAEVYRERRRAFPWDFCHWDTRGDDIIRIHEKRW